MRLRNPPPLLCILALAAAPAPAARAEPFWQVSGVLGAVSDYRWRGVSQTDGGPALQAEATAAGANGLYLTAWASNVADWSDPSARARPAGAAHGQALELSATLGRTFDLGGRRLGVGITRYGYPGGQAGYFEIPVSLTGSLGRATVSAGAAWAPPQPGTGGRGDRYLYLAAAWNDPRWPMQPRLSLGHEQGGLGRTKLDWSAGAVARCGRLDISLDLAGADGGEGSTLVAAIQRRF